MIENKGWINRIKVDSVIRMFYINPRGFGPDKTEKMEKLKKEINDRYIEAVLFSSPDRRWNSIMKEQIRYKFKKIDRNVVINMSDSGDSSYMRSTWLPGETMSAV